MAFENQWTIGGQNDRAVYNLIIFLFEKKNLNCHYTQLESDNKLSKSLCTFKE